ncbi:hypothetical protein WOLCODRAFT_149836 [Wolfiporia cocos MD-104 SS10]|uniref:Uncharacterized protein n=1 Tax=Wolfiporia cocos (strain MD-104) TaxID=742152 RepID=A0A2H3JC76_WOLCO|nr:hypothetical protein WOLCODRAFT_149836 [Wolfiporia cocos MD-104 SS10]
MEDRFTEKLGVDVPVERQIKWGFIGHGNVKGSLRQYSQLQEAPILSISSEL